MACPGLKCSYCYQQQQREANPGDTGYDFDKMQAALLAAGVGKPDGKGGITGFTFFGGDGFATPVKDLEVMLEWAHTLGASAGVQTHGATMKDAHFALLKKYGMSIGFSIDGEGDLNDERRADSPNPEATRITTARSIANLERCLREGISASLIVTVHNTNAGDDDKLTRLIAWLLDLRDNGLKWVNLHLLELGHGDDVLSMNQARQIAVFRRLHRELVGFVSVSPFADMQNKLTSGNAHCTFNHCSPYSTPAVTGINGHGEAARCGRLNNDGVAWERSATHGYERYLALYLTPMSQGGCGGCRFFSVCGGHCPGEAEGGDWRRKTVHCQTLMAMFEDAERDLFAEGKEPISMSLRRPLVEYQMLSRWAGVPDAGNLSDSGNREHGDVDHGDHDDTERPIIIDSEGKRIQ